MNEDQRWGFITELDEDLLKGGVIESEKSACLIRDADTSFVAEAFLSCILTSVAAIESHLRSEYSGGFIVENIPAVETDAQPAKLTKDHGHSTEDGTRMARIPKRLAELIDASDLEEDLKKELHLIRRSRNSWVHVDDPWDDRDFLDNPDKAQSALFKMAKRCLIALRRTIYSNPWV